MRWGNWELVTDRYPPVLINSRWDNGVIKITSDVHDLLSAIFIARAQGIYKKEVDVFRLIDAINEIYNLAAVLECSFSEAAFALSSIKGQSS